MLFEGDRCSTFHLFHLAKALLGLRALRRL
jgi:hypothetical protein